jgi:magnesium transporter
VASKNPIPILPEFDAGAIKQRLDRHEFFWADLTVPQEASIDEIAAAFSLDPEAVAALKLFGAPPQRHNGAPARRVHVDDEHVLFPFWCVWNPDAPLDGRRGTLDMFEVKVVLHGDYLLTVHRADHDLRDLVGEKLPRGRGERYAVYVVLEAMTSTFFRSLLVLQETMGELEVALFEAGGRTPQHHRQLIQAARIRLTELRTVAGPQRVLFERAGGEMEHVPGLEEDHGGFFDRINHQLDRVIDGIDAASHGLSSALEVQLNATTYRLTIVATIFLPLTLLTGFFGMNFDWMIEQVGTEAAFLIYGVGGLVGALILIVGFLSRQGAVTVSTPRMPRTRSTSAR